MISSICYCTDICFCFYGLVLCIFVSWWFFVKGSGPILKIKFLDIFGQFTPVSRKFWKKFLLTGLARDFASSSISEKFNHGIKSILRHRQVFFWHTEAPKGVENCWNEWNPDCSSSRSWLISCQKAKGRKNGVKLKLHQPF